VRPPYALSPHFEFGRERLYFLTRANNYDDRVGRMVWGPAVEAQRLRRAALVEIMCGERRAQHLRLEAGDAGAEIGWLARFSWW